MKPSFLLAGLLLIFAAQNQAVAMGTFNTLRVIADCKPAEHKAGEGADVRVLYQLNAKRLVADMAETTKEQDPSLKVRVRNGWMTFQGSDFVLKIEQSPANENHAAYLKTFAQGRISSTKMNCSGVEAS